MVWMNTEFTTDVSEKGEKPQGRDAMLFTEFLKGEYLLEIRKQSSQYTTDTYDST
jgi:hypothetical protein